VKSTFKLSIFLFYSYNIETSLLGTGLFENNKSVQSRNILFGKQSSPHYFFTERTLWFKFVLLGLKQKKFSTTLVVFVYFDGVQFVSYFDVVLWFSLVWLHPSNITLPICFICNHFYIFKEFELWKTKW